MDFNAHYKDRFDFVKHRKKFFTISLVITVLGILILLFAGMNYGVDFRAGTSLDISVGQATDKAKIDQVFADSGLVPTILTIGGNNNDHVSARYNNILSEDEIKKVQTSFVKTFGDKVSQEVNTVSPDIARELGIKAMIAVGIASVAICIYVSIRFEWRFAIAAIISILHDAFIVISLFAIFRLEVNLPFLAAVLTTIGYSINDKIIIFDRIRENLRFAKVKTNEDLADLIHHSTWQTMARNINTVVTVLVAVLCLFIFGSQSIKLFALAKMIGLASGAYSSICIASPLWYLLKYKSLGSKRKAAA